MTSNNVGAGAVLFPILGDGAGAAMDRVPAPATPEAHGFNGAASIHDYASKLRRPQVLSRVKETLDSFHVRRRPNSLSDALRCRTARVPGPVSINIDLTVACNYRCPHCIDGPILNTGKSFGLAELARSLVVLRLAGLRSVILIGGGEPTLHPKFREAVRMIKSLGLQCAVVSNGSSNGRLADVAPLLTKGDWIRLSLDAGSNATFRMMHLPNRRELTLEQICHSAGEIKRRNPAVSLGFSYIVSWQGASVCGQAVVDNVDEIAAAARLAKESGFDFIAFKPLLDRDEEGAETITIGAARERLRKAAILERVQAEFTEARLLEDERFKVFASLNLRALAESSEVNRLRSQPDRCHMRLFRQVLSPLGTFGCPAYRGNSKDQVGTHLAYASVEGFFLSRRRTCELVDSFDARRECRNVTCIYNASNWWLEALREGRESPQPVHAASDYFL